MAAGGIFLTLYSVETYDGAFASMRDFFAKDFTATYTFENNVQQKLYHAFSLTNDYANEESMLAMLETQKQNMLAQLEKEIVAEVRQCEKMLQDDQMDEYYYSSEPYYTVKDGEFVVDEAKIRQQLTVQMERDLDFNMQTHREQAQWLRQELEKEQALKFAVVNHVTGVTYTNIEGKDFKAAVKAMPWYVWDTKLDSGTSDKIQRLGTRTVVWDEIPLNKIEIYAGFDEAAAVASKGAGQAETLTRMAKNFHAFKRVRLVIFAALLLMLTICCLCAANLIATAGRREKGGELHMRRTDRIWNFFHWGAGLGIGLIFPVAVLAVLDRVGFSSFVPAGFLFFSLSFIPALAFWGETVCSIARHAKNRTVWKNTLGYKLWCVFQKGIEHRSMKRNTVLILLGFVVWGIISGFIIIWVMDSLRDGAWILAAIFILPLLGGIAAFFLLLKHLNALDEIRTALGQAKQGDLAVSLEPEHMPAGIKTVAEGVLNMRQGMDAAVQKAVAGERMRTELITNVSHDLKTPLTSVINYVELLRRDGITEEERSDYLLTLSQKSEQLGRLVEDLVEASKASSGNVELNLVEVNLHELALQAMGETSDALSAQGIEVILQPAGEGPIVRADSQKTWRIIENLMSNVTKYTMPGTRVYLQLACENGLGGLMVKNISREALNVPAEELTQRFVRGDRARTGDGSGLGLSIAESLCAVQGGRFELNVDGDLFKAGVWLPLAG